MGRAETHARAHDLLERGYRLQLEGRLDDAKDCLIESIALEPTPEAHTFLGWALSNEGRIDEAIEQCERAIELDPDYGNPWSDIGAYLLEKGEVDRARAYLDRSASAKRHEHDHYSHVNLGRAWLTQGLLDRALTSFRRAVELEPRNRAARKAVREILRRFN